MPLQSFTTNARPRSGHRMLQESGRHEHGCCRTLGNKKRAEQRLHFEARQTERHTERLDTVLRDPAELCECCGPHSTFADETSTHSLQRRNACASEASCGTARCDELCTLRDQLAVQSCAHNIFFNEDLREVDEDEVRQLAKQLHRQRAREHRRSAASKCAPLVGAGIGGGLKHHHIQHHDRIPGMEAPLSAQEAACIARCAGCSEDRLTGSNHDRRDDDIDSDAEAIAWRLARNGPRKKTTGRKQLHCSYLMGDL